MRTEKQTILSLEGVMLKNPTWSAYISLAFFVKGRNYLREAVLRRLLKRFVPKGEFERKDEDKLVEHLIKQTQYESV